MDWNGNDFFKYHKNVYLTRYHYFTLHTLPQCNDLKNYYNRFLSSTFGAFPDFALKIGPSFLTNNFTSLPNDPKVSMTKAKKLCFTKISSLHFLLSFSISNRSLISYSSSVFRCQMQLASHYCVYTCNIAY